MTISESSLVEVEAPWQAMEIPVLYSAIVNGWECGVRVRTTSAGRLEGQAWAAVFDGSELTSDIFGVIPQADRPGPLNPYNTSVPFPTRELSVESIEARVAAQAVARAKMKEDEASPLDLIHLAHDLQLQAVAKERQWQAEQERLAEQTRQDEEDMALAMRVQRGLELLAQQKKVRHDSHGSKR